MKSPGLYKGSGSNKKGKTENVSEEIPGHNPELGGDRFLFPVSVVGGVGNQ